MAILFSTVEETNVFAAYHAFCFWSKAHLQQLAHWHSAYADLQQHHFLSFPVCISMQLLPVNSTTGLFSGLLAHWARKELYSLAKRNFSLAPGVGLADFSSPAACQARREIHRSCGILLHGPWCALWIFLSFSGLNEIGMTTWFGLKRTPSYA